MLEEWKGELRCEVMGCNESGGFKRGRGKSSGRDTSYSDKLCLRAYALWVILFSLFFVTPDLITCVYDETPRAERSMV